jgi:hypothetical protein
MGGRRWSIPATSTAVAVVIFFVLFGTGPAIAEELMRHVSWPAGIEDVVTGVATAPAWLFALLSPRKSRRAT